MKKIYNNILVRWKAETPKIWKKIRNIATVLSVIIPIMSAVDNAPDWFTSSKWYLLSTSLAIAGISQLQKKKDDEGDTIIVKKDNQ